jgi:hypothetical protein
MKPRRLVFTGSIASIFATGFIAAGGDDDGLSLLRLFDESREIGLRLEDGGRDGGGLRHAC